MIKKIFILVKKITTILNKLHYQMLWLRNFYVLPFHLTFSCLQFSLELVPIEVFEITYYEIKMFSSLSFSSHKLQASKLDTINRSCVYQDFLITYTTSVLPWVLLGITVINSLIHVGINSTSNRQLIIDYTPSALDTEYKVVGGGALLWWSLHSSWGGKRQLKNAKII